MVYVCEEYSKNAVHCRAYFDILENEPSRAVGLRISLLLFSHKTPTDTEEFSQIQDTSVH